MLLIYSIFHCVIFQIVIYCIKGAPMPCPRTGGLGQGQGLKNIPQKISRQSQSWRAKRKGAWGKEFLPASLPRQRITVRFAFWHCDIASSLRDTSRFAGYRQISELKFLTKIKIFKIYEILYLCKKINR